MSNLLEHQPAGPTGGGPTPLSATQAEVGAEVSVTPIVARRAARKPAWDGPLDPEAAATGGRAPLPGIGPARAAAYARAGLLTRRHLLYHLPARYRRREAAAPLAELAPGGSGALCGTVLRSSLRRRGRRSTVSLVLACDGGGEVTVLIFNRPYLAKALRRQRVWVAGRLDAESRRLLAADYERLPPAPGADAGAEDAPGDARAATGDAGPAAHAIADDAPPSGPPHASLLPIYRLPEGIPPRVHRKALAALLADARVDDWREPAPGEPDLDAALRAIHLGHDLAAARAARRRLARDEAFALSLEVAERRRKLHGRRGVALPVDDARHAGLLARLPHVPTAGQARVIDELRRDLAAPDGRPMARLLQGDVGSGKTLVAVYALLAAVAAGRQGALMAPTEILARQHAATLTDLLRVVHGEDAPGVALIVGGGSAAERREQRAALAEGRAALAVGTHGLASPSVDFADLAVTVVDEQHRFGVRQRVRFRGQGESTHLLVMTATPIPRTLALTAYGELDVSVLDELPPGRAPRTTEFVAAGAQPALWRRLGQRIAAGEQGYVVCPSISGSAPTAAGDDDEPAAHSVAATLERVRERLGPDVRVEAVHGRMPAERQGRVLDAFRAGEIDVLVATVLIEVGLDVPAATFVVVPDPTRFGLATLHQIRGRVGRGGRAGSCHLLGPVKDGPARARVEALVAGEDGFELAEQDLVLRGPGELLGTRQSGMPSFAVLDPVRDVGILAASRAAALEVARDLSPARLRTLRERAFPRIELHAENLLAGG